MNIYLKKRSKRFIVLFIGCLLALLSIIKPVLIIFTLSAITMLYRRKVKKNKPLLFFLTGFFIVYIPFMYTENISLNDQMLTTYNLLKNEIVDTNIGGAKPLEKVRVLDDFEEKNEFTVELNGGLAKLTTTSEQVHEGKYSLKLEVKTPTKNEIILQKKVTPSNWGSYNYFNLWIKNKGQLGWFGIILIDEDGDWWHYDNDQILKKQDWTLLKVPLASLRNYEWSKHGNRKMDNIIGYRLKFGPYQKESDYEVMIDDIHLSKF